MNGIPKAPTLDPPPPTLTLPKGNIPARPLFVAAATIGAAIPASLTGRLTRGLSQWYDRFRGFVWSARRSIARAAATRRQCCAQRPAASHRLVAAFPSLQAAVDIRLEARASAVAAHLWGGSGGGGGIGLMVFSGVCCCCCYCWRCWQQC